MDQQQSNRDPGRSHTALPKISIPTRRHLEDLSTSNSPKADSPSTNTRPEAKADSSKERTPVARQDQKPKRHHSHHFHRRQHRHHHAKDSLQSTAQLANPFSFDSYNPLRRTHDKQDKHSRHSHESSRREDNSGGGGGDRPPSQDQRQPQPDSQQEAQDATIPIKKLVRPEDVDRERRRRERRSDEVNQALNALTKDAHTATRKLDETYYALLEKLGTLTSTISSLQDLSSQAGQAREDWARDVAVVETETEGKLASFGGFETQEAGVEDLVRRLKDARTKSGSLEQRLESCRSRLVRIEEKEEEGRKIVHRRWRIGWAVLASLLLVVLLLVVWKRNVRTPDLLVDLRERAGGFVAELGIADNETDKEPVPGLRLVDENYERQRQSEDARWNRLLDEL